MIYAIFTYRDDSAALTQCLRGIRAIDPLAHIAIFDDSSAPLPFAPDGVFYRRTDFDRGGNLNGLPCCAGILRCFLETMDYFNDDCLIKTDADMIILHPPDFMGIDYAGSEGFYWGFAAGAYYHISREIVQTILNYMISRDWANTVKFAEDETIGRLAMMHSNKWVLFPSSDDRIRGIGSLDHDHLREQAQWGLYNNSIALHFGQMRIPGLAGLPRTEARQQIARTMADFIQIYDQLNQTNQ